jgi:NADH:ubiquinone oxidoreductase subunit F (NADH-binding)
VTALPVGAPHRIRSDHLPRLLAGPPDADGGSDLDTHLAVHGPVGLPVDDDPRWRAAMSRSVAESGVRGRGGASFPVGLKWAAVGRSSRRAVVVVNAMEGEPASIKDRILCERAPHLVLDGAEVVRSIIGGSEVVVCVPEHHDAAAAAVQRAVVERQRVGRGGHPVSVQCPPGRYVAGEESALVGWLERGRPLPALRVDKSVPLTLRRRPVLVHNAETLAQVALIARHGPEWFRQCGTVEAPGTTLVTVTGTDRLPVLVEVELGCPVVEILDRAGIDHPLNGVLVGGYGGAWLGPGHVSTPYAPGPLADAGAALGVGVLVALPRTSCGIMETARVARYMAGESAGQCGPCVFGLPAVADDLELLAHGLGGADLMARMERRLSQIDGRGACRHPDGVARLVRSALAMFADDVRAHRGGHPCPGARAPTVMILPTGGWPA